MKVNSKQLRFLREVLESWEKESLISHDQSERLQSSLDVRSFNWKVLAGYLFWAALSSFLLSFFAVLMDDILLDWLKQLFSLSPGVKSLSLFVLALAAYFFGHKFQSKERFRQITRELIYLPGTMLMAGSIYFLGVAIDTGSGHFSILVLFLAVVYLIAAVMLSSVLVWCVALLCLAVGVVSEVVYQLEWGREFLDNRVAMLMTIYGLWGLGLSYSLLVFEKVKRFFAISQSSSLVICLFALWLLSVTGFDDEPVYGFSFLSQHGFWLTLFTLASVCTAAIGFWINDAVFRVVGVSFVFINIYTRFFEYAWGEMHKALFFALLGGSFWLLGRITESIWAKMEKKTG